MPRVGEGHPALLFWADSSEVCRSFACELHWAEVGCGRFLSANDFSLWGLQAVGTLLVVIDRLLDGRRDLREE
jgi:hypothetical protein